MDSSIITQLGIHSVEISTISVIATAFATVVLAVCTIWLAISSKTSIKHSAESAKATLESAKANKHTVESQIMIHFFQWYSTPQMREDLEVVKRLGIGIDDLIEKGSPKSTIAHHLRKLTDHRRNVKYYFVMAYKLLKLGYIGPILFNEIVAVEGRSILFKYCEPIDYLICKLYETSYYEEDYADIAKLIEYPRETFTWKEKINKYIVLIALESQ